MPNQFNFAQQQQILSYVLPKSTQNNILFVHKGMFHGHYWHENTQILCYMDSTHSREKNSQEEIYGLGSP
jgi:hypothetical protein